MNWSWIILAGIMIVVLTLNVFAAYLYGVKVGRRCSCCDFDMDCRFCVAAKCPNARRSDSLSVHAKVIE